MTDKPRLFLSYARKDDDGLHPDSLVKRLYKDLTDTGYDTWWDRENMPSRGEEFLPEIRDAITPCGRLILLVGAGVKPSDYVRAEWEYALSRCIVVTPILINGDFSLIPEEIDGYDCTDFRLSATRTYENARDELFRKLGQLPLPLGTLYAVKQLPNHYIERTNPLGKIIDAIRADAVNPVVITAQQQTSIVQGMGGIGKTTMAVAVAHDCQIQRSFPDGIFWLELGKTPDIAARQADIGVAFGDTRNEYPDIQSGKARLSSILASRKILIILNDVWEHGHVEAFRLAGTNRCRILVTTRNTRLASILGTIPHTLGILTEGEGLALIVKRLGLSEGNPQEDTHRAIVQLLGGHTLAITLAAAQLFEKGESYAPGLLERLQRQFSESNDPFKDLELDEDDKDLNVGRSLQLSYEDLNDDLKHRFRLLGAFAPGSTFDLNAAAAVWQDSDPHDSENALDVFVRQSLIEINNGRYSLHALIQAYAGALARQVGEYDTAQKNHYSYYLKTHGSQNLNFDSQRYPLIEVDMENIQQGIKYGMRDNSLVVDTSDFITSLKPYLNLRGSIDLRQAMIDTSLNNSIRIGYELGIANSKQALAELRIEQGDFVNARQLLEDTITICGKLIQPLGLANSFKSIGDIYKNQSQFKEARDFYNKSIEIHEKIGDKRGEASAYQILGHLERLVGNYEQARQNQNKAREISISIDDKLGKANALFSLADLDARGTQFQDSISQLEEALSLYREIGTVNSQANALKDLGISEYAIGNVLKARQYHHEALELYRSIPDLNGEKRVLKAMGDIEIRENNYVQAEAYLSQALKLAEITQDDIDIASTLRSTGDLLTAKGQYREAIVYYEKAIKIAPELQTKMVVKATMAIALSALGRDIEAIQNLLEATTYFKKIKAVANSQTALGQMIKLKKKMGELRFLTAWRSVTGQTILPPDLQV